MVTSTVQVLGWTMATPPSISGTSIAVPGRGGRPVPLVPARTSVAPWPATGPVLPLRSGLQADEGGRPGHASTRPRRGPSVPLLMRTYDPDVTRLFRTMLAMSPPDAGGRDDRGEPTADEP